MFCPRCGKEMPDEAGFCMQCGANISQIKQGGAPVNPYPEPYPTPYPQQPDSRNVVSFMFSLVSAGAFVGALITMLSATSSLSLFGETIYSHVDEEVALLAAIIGALGFVFGLVSVITAPKRERRNSLGTFGFVFGIIAMIASAATAVISLLMIF